MTHSAIAQPAIETEVIDTGCITGQPNHHMLNLRWHAQEAHGRAPARSVRPFYGTPFSGHDHDRQRRAGQLHAVEQAQQPVGRVRNVMLAGLPVMQSPFGDVKKLRAALQVKAQIAVHGPEPKRKLGAGFRVMAA